MEVPTLVLFSVICVYTVADAVMAVGYVAYHIYVRIQMIVHTTRSRMVHLIHDHLQQSFDSVEQGASQLGVLLPGSHARCLWEKARVATTEYTTSRGKTHGRRDVSEQIQEAGRCVKDELKMKLECPFRAIVPHVQNMQALVANTMRCQMMDTSGVVHYVQNSVEVPHSVFKEQYVQSLETVGALMETALNRQLTQSEIENLHLAVVWQSENFLSQLKTRTGNSVTQQSANLQTVTEHGMSASVTRSVENISAGTTDVQDTKASMLELMVSFGNRVSGPVLV